MSERLIQIFLGDTPVHLDDQTQGESKLLWKVVLRTGTWKLRPGPGGVKLNTPLKIYRDKAPKGHISLTALKQNFEGDDKGPAKEHVTVPMAHVDGTVSDGGFVKKLVIQDVPGEDGKGVKESLLWAGMEITDSELNRKLSEKSLRGVSGGILFDYERTEDAKKFDQVLSHVMVTNSPWINGTGDFKDQLPEGVMAAEPDDLPVGEVEFSSRETDPQPQLPAVRLADPPATSGTPATLPNSTIIWKPEQGFRFTRGKVQKALERWRDTVMAGVPQKQRYPTDWPEFSIDDVSLASEGGTALVCSGYGSDQDTWVAGFKLNSDGEAELDPFVKWTPAKQEWVAASEQPTPNPARPAGRGSLPRMPARTPVRTSPMDLGLREAQAARAERTRVGSSSINTGGSMGLMDLLSGVDLSDEQREALLAEERRLAGFEESEKQRRERERRTEVIAYCGQTKSDGTVVKGKLDELGLGDPGVKKFIRNALLSDDGAPAIAYSVHLEDGTSTTPVEKTSTDLLKEFIDLLPKVEQGRANLSEQARRLPDDAKPPEENNEDKLDMSAKAVADRSDALLAEMRESGYDIGTAVPTGSGS
jgi:hypothetical protein